MESLKCKDCGSKSFKKIDDNTYQCVYCGGKVHKSLDDLFNEEKKSKPAEPITIQVAKQEQHKNIDTQLSSKKKFAIIKLILCLCLGIFGVHRFVEGKVFSGFVYLFTYGLFGIGLIYDIIRLISELIKS